jgi:hypothetical protein
MMRKETPTNPAGPASRRRRTAALWGSGLFAAVVLILGVNGTLSSWTTALITNNSNTAGATASYLALVETDGTSTCDTTTSANNTDSTCSTINKYGGNTTMSPGDSSRVDVTFTNPGTAAGNTFSYAPGTCAPTNGTNGVNLCTQGDLNVAVACSTGTTYNAAALIGALGQSGAPGSLVTKSWTSAPALAAASASAVTCRFTTSLSSASPPADSGSQVAQPITWTINAV